MQPGTANPRPLADERLVGALAAWRSASSTAVPAARAEVLAALLDATVYASVAASSTGEELAAGSGLRAESGAELAVLLLEASDGHRALPVFSTLDELRHWQPDARPVPLTGSQACAAAGDEGAAHVLVDPRGAAFAVEPDELVALAAGWVPIAGSALSARTGVTPLEAPELPVDDELIRALRVALSGEQLRAARLVQGSDGLVLGVTPRSPLDPASLAALTQRVADRLGGALPAGGLGVTQVAARGPGVQVFGRSWRRHRRLVP